MGAKWDPVSTSSATRRMKTRSAELTTTKVINAAHNFQHVYTKNRVKKCNDNVKKKKARESQLGAEDEAIKGRNQG